MHCHWTWPVAVRTQLRNGCDERAAAEAIRCCSNRYVRESKIYEAGLSPGCSGSKVGQSLLIQFEEDVHQGVLSTRNLTGFEFSVFVRPRTSAFC